MLKWFIWIWENVSNLDSFLNIAGTICVIISTLAALVMKVLQLKLKYSQKKHLRLIIDAQTDESMKYYIPTRVQSEDPCSGETYIASPHRFELIPFMIKQGFRDSASQYYMILADSGMGKTTFALKLFFVYYRKIFRKHDIYLIPLSLRGAVDKIKEVKKSQNTILILDGFDEDQFAMEDYVQRLKEICDETEMFYKVIITCRTQFFPDRDSEPKDIGKIKFGVGNKSLTFEKFYISPFDETEIDVYLKKKYRHSYEGDKIRRSKELVLSCPEIMVRPMLLAYIDDLIEDKTKKYTYVYEIYEELIFKWIERESVDNKALYSFSEKVAEYMYAGRTIYISSVEIGKLCDEFEIKIASIEAKSRSLLNRNSEGIYKFAHKSILEYFLAKEAFEDLAYRKMITEEKFCGYDMAQFFLREMSMVQFNKIMMDKTAEIKDVSLKYLQLPNIDFSGKTLIYCDFEGCNLTKVNFSDALLKGVNLKNSNLKKANFKWTVFQTSSLVNADLTEADFRNANVRGADFAEAVLDDIKIEKALFSNIQVKDLEQVIDMEESNVYRNEVRGIVSYKKYFQERKDNG